MKIHWRMTFHQHNLLAQEMSKKWNCLINLTEVHLILLSRLVDRKLAQAPLCPYILIIRFSKRLLTHYTNAKTCSKLTSASSRLMIETSTMWPGVTFRAPLCTNSTFWGQMHESKCVLSSPNTTERIYPSSGKCLKPIPLYHVITKMSTQTLLTHKQWKSFRASSLTPVQYPVKLTNARVLRQSTSSRGRKRRLMLCQSHVNGLRKKLCQYPYMWT